MRNTKGSFAFRYSFFLQALLIAFVLMAAAAGGADLFLSPAGDDANPGTWDQPLKTLERARQEARSIKGANGGHMPAGGITVWLRGGRYELQQTFVLGAEDSGEEGRPMVYRAYDDEIPVLSGGRLIQGWQKVEDVVPGMPANATGKVWSVMIPEATNGLWPFRQLWANGKRLTRARWPNNGDFSFQVADVIAKASEPTELWRQQVLAGWKTIDLLNAGDVQAFPGNSLPADLGAGPAELFVRNAGGWATMRIPVEQAAGTRMTMKAPLGYLWYYWGGTFMMCAPQSAGFIENALSLLDQPGEWFLDRTTGRLYVIPGAGEDPNDQDIVAPKLEQLVGIRGASGIPASFIELRGLRMEHAEWPLPDFGYRPMLGCYYGEKVTPLAVEPPVAAGSLRANDQDPDYCLPAAVDLMYARDCLLELCRVGRVGATGIGLGEGSRRNRVIGCEVFDAGGNGIHAGLAHGPICAEDFAWANADDEPLTNEIGNCYVHHNGQMDWGAFGIISSYCRGNRIAHNLVEQQPYSGICACFTMAAFPSGRKELITVESNHIRNVLLKLRDGGGIYTKDGVTNTSTIRCNLIHDIGGVTSANNGIFLDDMSYGFFIESNIIYGVQQPVRCNINNTHIEDFTWGVNYFGVGGYPPELAAQAGLEEPYKSLLLSTPAIPITPVLSLQAESLTGTYANGQKVALWTNSVGGGADAIQVSDVNRPLFVTNALNGRSVVRFNGVCGFGTQNYLDIASLSIPQPFTVFVVARINGNGGSGSWNDGGFVGAGASDVLFDYTGSGNRVVMSINGSGTDENHFILYSGGSDYLDAPESRNVWTNWHVWEGDYDGASSAIYRDGAQQTAGGTMGTEGLSSLRLGVYCMPDHHGLNGDIAEVLIYSGTPASAEREAIVTRLKTKYGLGGRIRGTLLIVE